MDRDDKTGWGYEDRGPDAEEPPPPEHAGPVWLNPKFIFPTLAFVAIAVALSIIIRDDGGDGPGQQATTPTIVGASSTTSTSGVTTTAGAATTLVIGSTTLPDPFAGIPPDFVAFGQGTGLTPEEIVDRFNFGLMPYDGTWYPTPANNPPDSHGPGIDRYGFFTIDLPLSGFPAIDVPPGPYDVTVLLLDEPPHMTVPSGGTQIGIGIGCGDALPERSGLDGLGDDAWTAIQFYGTDGYTSIAGGAGGTPPVGFGFTSGSMVVLGVRSDPDCLVRAISNFYRDVHGVSATADDPAEYQYGDSTMRVSFDPWD